MLRVIALIFHSNFLRIYCGLLFRRVLHSGKIEVPISEKIYNQLNKSVHWIFKMYILRANIYFNNAFSALI